ncbi:MAG: hypothetical protein ACTSVZ_12620 [Promethearchaeota archaeon]
MSVDSPVHLAFLAEFFYFVKIIVYFVMACKYTGQTLHFVITLSYVE